MKKRSRRGLRYVVHRHAARSLHYDFRLEHGGVLWSWSVPKGPSRSPAVRRLAVRTPDHPLAYADFEGEIPKGQYGAGKVHIWDTGTWRPEGDAGAAMKEGRLSFELDGQRLKGRWHLVRTHMDGGGRESWLLFKARAGARAAKATRAVAGGAGELPAGLRFTSVEKVLYPEQGITKGDLIAYYALVAERMLPYVAGRPLTLVRCPNGCARPCFFQKHAQAGVPDAIERVAIREASGTRAPCMVVRDRAGLLATAQLGALELHTWMSRVDDLEHPDQLVFDLDPDAGLAWKTVVAAAQELRERLAAHRLTSFVKTTGGKGLHVVAPVQRRRSYDEHRQFALELALAMERDAPELYTTNARKAQRTGRIYLDTLRNGRGATAVAPYSTRARDGAPVATPISWDELRRGVDPRDFTLTSVPKRLASLRKDPWSGYARLRQSLPRRRA